MEAVVLTLILVALILTALIVLARTWPHSSRYTGYRIRDHDEPARPIREDDDAPPWHVPPPGAGPSDPG